MLEPNVILTKRAGNHSNRLIQNAHLEAWCIENGVHFYNQDLDDLANLYCAPARKPGKLSRFIYWSVKQFDSEKIKHLDFNKEDDQNDRILNELIKSKNIILVKGFYFRSKELVLKHQNLLRRKYSLKKKYLVSNSLVEKIKHEKNQKTIIGIHIRRGDYQQYNEGIYYYSNEDYLNWIHSLKNTFHKESEKPILFILFSNETVNIPSSDDLFISSHKWYIDQHVMSLCDYLIGPPSTFTLWASFIGNVPLKHMYRANAKIQLDQFHVSNITNSSDLG